jgi:hypothetical protein
MLTDSLLPDQPLYLYLTGLLLLGKDLHAQR